MPRSPSMLKCTRITRVGPEESKNLLQTDPVEAWQRMWRPLDSARSEAAAVAAVTLCLKQALEDVRREGGETARGTSERERVAAIVRMSDMAALEEGLKALQAMH